MRKIILLTFSIFLFTISCKQATVDNEFAWVDEVGAHNTPNGTDVWKVTDWGAIADGETLNTASIQKAIDACSNAGGGIVTFEPGKYLTGSI